MDFTCIFFGILFTLAGLWFAFGKGYLHLSLWKNMPQKEKDKLRIIPLCRNIGGIITLNRIIILYPEKCQPRSLHRIVNMG